MTDIDFPGAGEAAEGHHRKAFWNALMPVVIGGMLVGGFFGFYLAASHRSAATAGMIAAMPDGLLIGLCAVGALAFFYGCWRFAKVIDEVELVDNLWASTAAYYLYATLFPLWWVLAEKRLVPPINGWALYFTALFAGCLAYGWRKWRAR